MAAAREIRVLWEEYEANETKEAKLVKDFDKVGRETKGRGFVCVFILLRFLFEDEEIGFRFDCGWYHIGSCKLNS